MLDLVGSPNYYFVGLAFLGLVPLNFLPIVQLSLAFVEAADCFHFVPMKIEDFPSLIAAVVVEMDFPIHSEEAADPIADLAVVPKIAALVDWAVPIVAAAVGFHPSLMAVGFRPS